MAHPQVNYKYSSLANHSLSYPKTMETRPKKFRPQDAPVIFVTFGIAVAYNKYSDSNDLF